MKSKTKTVAILGTRGIPNTYGGFEQFAEHLSLGLAEEGYDVIVYNPNFHPYREPYYKNESVRIIHKWCPEKRIGAGAHFIYDFLCLRDALKKDVSIILELGYMSSALSMLIYSRSKRFKNTFIIANMDGMEWKRQKWNSLIRAFARWTESICVKQSHMLVADNPGIKSYIKETYSRDAFMIPYGAEVFGKPDISVLEAYGLDKNRYYILIARMEPENNIETVLDGYLGSGSDLPFIVVGNVHNGYGRYLVNRYRNPGSMIRFTGGIFNTDILNNLRFFSNIYFHGHSVGGTNPSLLEAMAAGALIAAHDNIFNRSVLGDEALYFKTKREVTAILSKEPSLSRLRQQYTENNIEKIRLKYRWDLIVKQYCELFENRKY